MASDDVKQMMNLHDHIYKYMQEVIQVKTFNQDVDRISHFCLIF